MVIWPRLSPVIIRIIEITCLQRLAFFSIKLACGWTIALRFYKAATETLPKRQYTFRRHLLIEIHAKLEK